MWTLVKRIVGWTLVAVLAVACVNFIWRYAGLPGKPLGVVGSTVSAVAGGAKDFIAQGSGEEKKDATITTVTPSTPDTPAAPAIIQASLPMDVSTDYVSYGPDKDVILVYLYAWKGGKRFLDGGFVKITERSSGAVGVMFVRAGAPVEFTALRGQSYEFQAVDYLPPARTGMDGTIVKTLGSSQRVDYNGAPSGYARKAELDSERKL